MASIPHRAARRRGGTEIAGWVIDHRHALLLLVLALVTAATYANSLSNGFHYDDWHGIVRNPAVKDLVNIPRYFIDPSTFSLSHHDDWRPILQVSYALNYYFGGLNPTNFRIFNLLIHIASAALVYAIARETFKTAGDADSGQTWMAPTAAFLFALHPVNSEMVNYIWARSSLLAAFFYLGGFYCFLRGRTEAAGRTKRPWAIGALGAYVLGLGTKATAITLPGAIVLYEFLQRPLLNSQSPPFRAWLRATARNHAPMIGIGLIYVTFRILLLPDSFGRVVDTEEITRSTYLWSSMRAWVHYLALFFWPSSLLVNSTTFGWSRSFGDTEVLGALGVVLALLFLAWKIGNSDKTLAFFILWFFLTLLPEQSFLPLSEPINGYRPYLAYAGLSLALPRLLGIGWHALRQTGERRPLAARCLPVAGTVTLVGLMIVLAWRTVERNRDWRNERTLWSDVLRHEPDNPRALLGVGLEYLAERDYSNARVLFDRAVALAPRNGYAYLLRGYLYQVSEEDNRALENYSRAVTLNPRSTHALYYRGELLAGMGRHREAIDDFERALRLKQYFTDARYGLALAYFQRGDLARTKQHCECILDVDRYDVRAYRCLGNVAMKQRDFAGASGIYERGLTFLPSNRELWRDLGVAYAARGMYGPALTARQKSLAFATATSN